MGEQLEGSQVHSQISPDAKLSYQSEQAPLPAASADSPVPPDPIVDEPVVNDGAQPSNVILAESVQAGEIQPLTENVLKWAQPKADKDRFENLRKPKEQTGRSGSPSEELSPTGPADNRRESRDTEAPRELTADELEMIATVCVFPRLSLRSEIKSDAQVYVVYGPENTGKFTCSVKVSLYLFEGEHPPSENYEQTRYLAGLDQLLNQTLNQFGRDHKAYDEALIYQQRLMALIDDKQRYGNTETLSHNIAVVIHDLNSFALKFLNRPFNELCVPIVETARPHLKVFRRTPRDQRSLIDYVQHPKLSAEDICIIEDGIFSKADIQALSDPLFNLLKRKSLRLILTTTWQFEQLTQLPEQVGKLAVNIENKAAHDRFVHNVLDAHLRYYHQSIAEPVRIEVVTRFKQPYLVNEFCKRRGELPWQAEPRQEIELINEIAGYSNPTFLRKWFDSLNENAKLYAMLVALFNGLHRQILEEFYLVAVTKLRADGVTTLDDPRRYGFNEILERIHAVERVRSVDFTDPAFEREVQRQIGSYRHQLWSLMDLLMGLIENYSAPEYWEFRKALGIAIGQIGRYYANAQDTMRFVSKLEAVLNTLALHKSGGVASVAGYALNELCCIAPESHAFVTDLLKQWIESGDPDLMWAAAASIWRIHEGLARIAKLGDGKSIVARQAAETLLQAKALLDQLASTFDQFSHKARLEALIEAMPPEQREQATLSRLLDPVIAQRVRAQLDLWSQNNVNAILHAIYWIALFDPVGAVRQIKGWLASKDKKVSTLGELAGLKLFEESADPNIQLIEQRHEPLLDLVDPLLRSSQEVADVIIQTLLIWLKQPDWTLRVQRTLRMLANRTTEDEASRLIDALSNVWLNADSSEAEQIGKSLIARASAMLGMPLDLPGYCAALVLDTSRDGRRNRIVVRLGRELYERLGTLIPVQVLRMGGTGVVAKDGVAVSTLDLLPHYARPRLLTPTLEQLPLTKLQLVLILTWDTIIDSDDLISDFWAERLLIVIDKQHPAGAQNARTVAVNLYDPDTARATIVAEVRAHLSQVLANRSADEWWSLLGEHLQCTPTDIDGIVARLESWIAQLDVLDTANPSVDLARAIICTSLWLARVAPRRCAAIVGSWLRASSDAEQGNLRPAIGTACSKAVLRLLTHMEPAPPIDTYDAWLELFPVLAQRDWNCIEVALDAARRWAVQPEWLHRLWTQRDGSQSEFAEFIDLVTQNNYEALANALDRWQKPQDTGPTPEPLIHLIQNIRIRMALKSRQELPVLPDGHNYGLIVVDTAGHQEQSRRHVDELAVKLIKQLRTKYQDRLVVLGYRMGSDFPVTISSDQLTSEAFDYPHVENRLTLLGPILESHTLAQVSFVLLLTVNNVLDDEDWQSTAWCDRIFRYANVSRLPESPFATIPKASESNEVDSILHYLSNNIGE
ncbi:hypothetical protein TFLX_03973 [Thermoflexales bacterium]|nr:hypothetical protein TFLX_03973 [Thermoflexales bacterium]